MMRNPLALVLGLLGCLPSSALAQTGHATTTVLIREAGATRAQSTLAGMGIRRGVRRIDGVRFLHPVDELEEASFSANEAAVAEREELEFAQARLDPLADQMRTGDTHDAARQADEIIEVFERNLGQVPRAQLVDAYMIAAVSRCLMGERRECQRRIGDIITWREGLEYDAERYGGESRNVFDRASASTLSGARATLIVQTEPQGAEVFIDGRSYGPSPARADGLLVGWHYVTVKELGFQRLVARAEVVRNEEAAVRYELAPSARAALLGERRLEQIRAELGNERASPDFLSTFRGTIPAATQVVVGVVRPAAGSAIHVQLYLYHLNTRNLQAQDEVTMSADEAGVALMEERTAALYEGVDLGGGLEAPDDETVVVGPQPELYEQWWFWVAVVGGAALVGAGIGIGFALEGANSLPPNGFFRLGGGL